MKIPKEIENMLNLLRGKLVNPSKKRLEQIKGEINMDNGYIHIDNHLKRINKSKDILGECQTNAGDYLFERYSEEYITRLKTHKINDIGIIERLGTLENICSDFENQMGEFSRKVLKLDSQYVLNQRYARLNFLAGFADIVEEKKYLSDPELPNLRGDIVSYTLGYINEIIASDDFRNLSILSQYIEGVGMYEPLSEHINNNIEKIGNRFIELSKTQYSRRELSDNIDYITTIFGEALSDNIIVSATEGFGERCLREIYAESLDEETSRAIGFCNITFR